MRIVVTRTKSIQKYQQSYHLCAKSHLFLQVWQVWKVSVILKQLWEMVPAQRGDNVWDKAVSTVRMRHKTATKIDSAHQWRYPVTAAVGRQNKIFSVSESQPDTGAVCKIAYQQGRKNVNKSSLREHFPLHTCHFRKHNFHKTIKSKNDN